MSDQMLDVLLYGDVTRSYFDMFAGYENVKYRRLSDPGSSYQGPSRPRPVKTAYRGYDWSDAGETYYFEDGGWVELPDGRFYYEEGSWVCCLDGSVWEGK